jgi:beta-lactamase class A
MENKSRNIIFLVVVAFTAMFFGFLAGSWRSKEKFQSAISSFYGSNSTTAMRLGGFTYISPLLVCDANPNRNSPDLLPLETQLLNFTNLQIKEKNVDAISVYFRDLKAGTQVVINKDEKFHPASMGKIPILITYLKAAENMPYLFEKPIKIEGGVDLNKQQEIIPKDFVVVGKTYTVWELLEKMIRFSDNNSTVVLANLMDVGSLKSVYQDLQVPLLLNSDLDWQGVATQNYLSANDLSYFFRVLYNATYVHRDLAEKALQLLTEVDFKNGLVAGVPESVKVAHKFGLASHRDVSGKVDSRELHDCGIVYHKDRPYLLCVMTRSSSSLPSAEKTISEVSNLVYKVFLVRTIN